MSEDDKNVSNILNPSRNKDSRDGTSTACSNSKSSAIDRRFLYEDGEETDYVSETLDDTTRHVHGCHLNHSPNETGIRPCGDDCVLGVFCDNFYAPLRVHFDFRAFDERWPINGYEEKFNRITNAIDMDGSDFYDDTSPGREFESKTSMQGSRHIYGMNDDQDNDNDKADSEDGYLFNYKYEDLEYQEDDIYNDEDVPHMPREWGDGGVKEFEYNANAGIRNLNSENTSKCERYYEQEEEKLDNGVIEEFEYKSKTDIICISYENNSKCDKYYGEEEKSNNGNINEFEYERKTDIRCFNFGDNSKCERYYEYEEQGRPELLASIDSKDDSYSAKEGLPSYLGSPTDKDKTRSESGPSAASLTVSSAPNSETSSCRSTRVASDSKPTSSSRISSNTSFRSINEKYGNIVNLESEGKESVALGDTTSSQSHFICSIRSIKKQDSSNVVNLVKVGGGSGEKGRSAANSYENLLINESKTQLQQKSEQIQWQKSSFTESDSFQDRKESKNSSMGSKIAKLEKNTEIQMEPHDSESSERGSNTGPLEEDSIELTSKTATTQNENTFQMAAASEVEQIDLNSNNTPDVRVSESFSEGSQALLKLTLSTETFPLSHVDEIDHEQTSPAPLGDSLTEDLRVLQSISSSTGVKAAIALNSHGAMILERQNALSDNNSDRSTEPLGYSLIHVCDVSQSAMLTHFTGTKETTSNKYQDALALKYRGTLDGNYSDPSDSELCECDKESVDENDRALGDHLGDDDGYDEAKDFSDIGDHEDIVDYIEAGDLGYIDLEDDFVVNNETKGLSHIPPIPVYRLNVSDLSEEEAEFVVGDKVRQKRYAICVDEFENEQSDKIRRRPKGDSFSKSNAANLKSGNGNDEGESDKVYLKATQDTRLLREKLSKNKVDNQDQTDTKDDQLLPEKLNFQDNVKQDSRKPSRKPKINLKISCINYEDTKPVHRKKKIMSEKIERSAIHARFEVNQVSLSAGHNESQNCSDFRSSIVYTPYPLNNWADETSDLPDIKGSKPKPLPGIEGRKSTRSFEMNDRLLEKEANPSSNTCLPEIPTCDVQHTFLPGGFERERRRRSLMMQEQDLHGLEQKLKEQLRNLNSKSQATRSANASNKSRQNPPLETDTEFHTRPVRQGVLQPLATNPAPQSEHRPSPRRPAPHRRASAKQSWALRPGAFLHKHLHPLLDARKRYSPQDRDVVRNRSQFTGFNTRVSTNFDGTKIKIRR